MSNKRAALGKGLGALISGLDQPGTAPVSGTGAVPVRTPAPALASICEIPVDKISANPYQPRSNFDEQALAELTDSIRQLGIIQPITVRKTGLRYQIISGERRFKAAKAAGLETIPAYIKDTDDQGMLEMAIVENVQRENLDPIELALSYQRLLDECRLTQDQLAERVGKKRATVANTIRLLKLPAKVQHDIKVGLLSAGHAKAILSVDDPEAQEQLCDLVIRDGLSVRELETLVRKLQVSPDSVPKKKEPAPQQLTDDYYRLLDRMGKYFSSEISLRRSASGKGTMTIRFNSDEEVKNFVKALEDKQF